MTHENPLVGHTAIKGMVGNDYPENRFVGPKGEEYFLQINPTTGETTVWNEEFGADKNVGTYNKDGDFIPNTNLWGGAKKEEKEFFNSDKGRISVKNQAKTVMQNEGGKINDSDKVLNSREQHEVTSEVEARTVDNESLAQDNALKKESARNEEMAAAGGTGVGRQQYSTTLCYPETLREGAQDRLKISVIKFKPKAMKGIGFSDRNQRIVSDGTRTSIGGQTASDFKKLGGGRSAFLGRTIIGSVVLPVNMIKDGNKTKWGEDSMNAGDIAKANLALTALDKGAKEMINAGGDMLAGVSKEDKDAVKQFFVGQATGVKGIMARTAGAVINPNMELIFGGPQLRSFGFTYRLSARFNKESDTIKKIIRMFKQSMAPQTTEKNLFLKAPNTYRLEYFTGANSSHSYLPKIKECALTGFDVNYTPDGSYMTYEDSSMVAYEITFAFQELDPIYNKDYTDLDGDSDSSVGY